MKMLDKLKTEQPETFDLMQKLSMIIVIADRVGETDAANNARWLFDCCIKKLEGFHCDDCTRERN